MDVHSLKLNYFSNKIIWFMFRKILHGVFLNIQNYLTVRVVISIMHNSKKKQDHFLCAV